MTEQISDETNNVEEIKEQARNGRRKLYRLLVPNAEDLSLIPTSAIESNFVPGFMKQGNDQYVYLHLNGLCVIDLDATREGYLMISMFENQIAVDLRLLKSA